MVAVGACAQGRLPAPLTVASQDQFVAAPLAWDLRTAAFSPDECVRKVNNVFISFALSPQPPQQVNFSATLTVGNTVITDLIFT